MKFNPQGWGFSLLFLTIYPKTALNLRKLDWELKNIDTVHYQTNEFQRIDRLTVLQIDLVFATLT